MQDRDKFLDLLQEVVQIAKVENRTPTKEEIRNWFKGMDLTEKQLAYINEYVRESLQNKKSKPKNQSLKMNAYVREIKKITPLTEEEKTKLYRALLSGDHSAKNRLVEGNLNKVLSVVRRLSRSIAMEEDELGEELIQEGNLALMGAMDDMANRMDPQDVNLDDKALLKKCDQYISKQIKNGLTTFLETETNLSDLEKSILAKTALVHEATKHLAEETGTVAGIRELSDYVKMSEEEVKDIVELSNGAIDIR